MPKFVELWVYLSATPLFGLTATLVVYVLAQAAYTRLQQAAWANPVLWSVITLASLLTLTGVDYPPISRVRSLSFLLGRRWHRVGRCRAAMSCASIGALC